MDRAEYLTRELQDLLKECREASDERANEKDGPAEVAA
jgi:hypothetical protein